MINIFFDNFYYKLCFAIILCMIAAFASQIDLLKHGAVAIILLILLLLMMVDDYSIAILLIALFVLTYNNVMFRHNNNDNKTSERIS